MVSFQRAYSSMLPLYCDQIVWTSPLLSLGLKLSSHFHKVFNSKILSWLATNMFFINKTLFITSCVTLWHQFIMNQEFLNRIMTFLPSYITPTITNINIMFVHNNVLLLYHHVGVNE